MKKLITILFLLAAIGVQAATERIELYVTVTNTPVTGDTLTVNGASRYWTNAHSSATILTNLESIAINNSMTNLFFNLSAYPLADRPVAIKTDTNKIRLIFPVGTVVSASESGDWAEFSLSTNTITETYGVRVPLTVEAETNRTNIASMLVTGLQYSTNPIVAHWSIGSQMAFLTNNNAFTGTNSLVRGGWNAGAITNATAISGVISAISNGLWNAGILISPTTTNLINYGNAISSVGSASGSEQFGSGADASGVDAIAVGNLSVASGLRSAAFGNGAEATGPDSVAAGVGAGGTATNAVAFGTGATANAPNSVALGAFVDVAANHTNSIGIGADTTKTNQILVGSSTHVAEVPGQFLVSGTITNATRTGSQLFGASGGPYATISISRYDNGSLANGDNLVDINGSSYVKVSGPSAAFAICNVTNGAPAGVVNGMRVIFQNNTTHTMTVKDASGTTVGVAANRILTGTGADIAITNTPGFVELIYDSGGARWGVLSHSD